MKAVVVYGAHDLRVEDREIPNPRNSEVLVRVAAVGVCGSDLHYYAEGRVGAFEVHEPLIVGHEVVGWVELDPAGEFAPGTPVTVHPATPGIPQPGLEDRPNVWAGSRYLGSAATTPHTQGAMSEFAVFRSDQLRRLPDGLSIERGVLAEPLGVALHGINRGGGVNGKRVLVSGAGPVGLLAAGAAVALGAQSVTVSDVLAEPLERALQLGVSAVVHIGETALPSQRFDLVLECSGSPRALSGVVPAAATGGVIVQIGSLPADPAPMVLTQVVARELEIRGSFRFNEEISDALKLLVKVPALEAIVTDRYAVSDALAAFDRAADARASGKVVVTLSERLDQ